MTVESRDRRRHRPGPVEPLEGRALLSAAAVRPPAPTPPAATQVVVSPSKPFVSQQDGSFAVNLYLKNVYRPQADATLAEPLTVDLRVSTSLSDGTPPGSDSPLFQTYRETVTFPPGASVETVTVPIRSTAAAEYPTTVFLTVTPATGTKTRVSTGYWEGVQLSRSPETSPPTVTDVRPVTDGALASAVVLRFSKPMAPATVEDVRNYRLLSRPQVSRRKGFLFWGGSVTTELTPVPLAAAKYDPSTSTVTLTLKRPTRESSLYQVASAYPVAGRELTDTEGRPVSTNLTFGSTTSGFTRLIHPIPGYEPPLAGPLKTTLKLDSPASNLNLMKGFS